MTPDAQDVAGVAAGLTEAQRRLIPHMSDGELVYPLPKLAEDIPVALGLLRKAAAGLRAMGLAQHGPLYDTDDGHPKGSGTWLTPLGLAVRAHLQGNRNDPAE